MNTIVSAFVSNINGRYENSINYYFKLGKILLLSSVPKIIFVDEVMFDLIGTNYDVNTTHIVKINKKDSYLYNYVNMITKFNINSTNMSKDTIEFMFTMCNKTEWVKKAIEINHFNTQHFIWVDFGIKHIFKNYSDEEFIKAIDTLKYKVYDNLRIGGIWNINYTYNIDIYKDVAWYFAGGVFGGNSESLLNFADQMKSYCIFLITTKNIIMWEVNIWYLIYISNIHNTYLFDIYYCDHNQTLINNY
jgi:hypothetical protein